MTYQYEFRRRTRTRRFRTFMSKILGDHRSNDPSLRNLLKEARRVRSALKSRHKTMEDFRAIAKFIGESAAYHCYLKTPLQEWIYVGGHLFTASDVDKMFPEGWRDEVDAPFPSDTVASIRPSRTRVSILP